MLYSNWIVKWLQRKEQLVKESTFAAYSNIVVNHLLPKFGEMKLEHITEEIIQDYVFDLLKYGRLDGFRWPGGKSLKRYRDCFKKHAARCNESKTDQNHCF